MSEDYRIRHLCQEWLIMCNHQWWYAQSEHDMKAGPFETAKQAEAWIKALRSSQTADKVESYGKASA